MHNLKLDFRLIIYLLIFKYDLRFESFNSALLKHMVRKTINHNA